MANKEHLKILKQGVEAWNEWRKKNPNIRPDLSRADLRNSDFIDIDFRDVNLSAAHLSHSKIRGNLTGVNLRRANLVSTDLTSATLVRADLTGANLMGTNLLWAVLTDASLRSAVIGHTVLADIDLSHAKDLEMVNHTAPSSIGTDTLLRSKGTIPEVFLRGAGLPDDLIQYFRSQTSPIEFNSCFISYSTKDQEFAQRLYNDLQANSVRCWFAPHDIQGGKKIHEQIDDAIRIHERVLLILSPESINSAWVKTEIAKTRKREIAEKRQMLFPIRLVEFDVLREWECFDADAGTDSAREIREYFIPDFSNWKDHDSYQKAFSKLLVDLKKGEKSKVAPAT